MPSSPILVQEHEQLQAIRKIHKPAIMNPYPPVSACMSESIGVEDGGGQSMQELGARFTGLRCSAFIFVQGMLTLSPEA